MSVQQPVGQQSPLGGGLTWGPSQPPLQGHGQPPLLGLGLQATGSTQGGQPLASQVPSQVQALSQGHQGQQVSSADVVSGPLTAALAKLSDAIDPVAASKNKFVDRAYVDYAFSCR